MIFKKVVILLSTIAIGSQVKSEVCITQAICTEGSCSVMFEATYTAKSCSSVMFEERNCTLSLKGNTFDCVPNGQLEFSNNTLTVICEGSNVTFNINCTSDAHRTILTTTPGQPKCSGEIRCPLLISTSSNSHHTMTTSSFILKPSSTMSWFTSIPPVTEPGTMTLTDYLLSLHTTISNQGTSSKTSSKNIKYSTSNLPTSSPANGTGSDKSMPMSSPKGTGSDTSTSNIPKHTQSSPDGTENDTSMSKIPKSSPKDKDSRQIITLNGMVGIAGGGVLLLTLTGIIILQCVIISRKKKKHNFVREGDLNDRRVNLYSDCPPMAAPYECPVRHLETERAQQNYKQSMTHRSAISTQSLDTITTTTEDNYAVPQRACPKRQEDSHRRSYPAVDSRKTTTMEEGYALPQDHIDHKFPQSKSAGCALPQGQGRQRMRAVDHVQESGPVDGEHVYFILEPPRELLGKTSNVEKQTEGMELADNGARHVTKTPLLQ